MGVELVLRAVRDMAGAGCGPPGASSAPSPGAGRGGRPAPGGIARRAPIRARARSF